MTIFVQLTCISLTRYVTQLLRLLILFASWGAFCAPESGAQKLNESRHVLIVVWDGMRPDFVSEQNTPTLWKLAREGITFRNHHSVYPSATMVNGTALVTGVYPGRNGITANHVYRPDIDPHHAVDVELSPVVKKGDDLSGGKYISVPTLAELVQRAGGRTVMAAAKTVGLLLDRKAGEDSGGAKRRVALFAGKSLPADIVSSISEKLGPFPSAHLQQDIWTTKALTDVLWKDGVPTLSVLWLGEPDLTQHGSAPGAPVALAAIKSADENLAAVLAALERSRVGGTRATTDVFVVSDHGFSTIERSIDLRKILNDAGFTAKTEVTDELKPGDIMLAGNGGSVLFYVAGHEDKTIRRLIEFLQQSDFAGVIFTKQAMDGTFGLDQAKVANDHSPDVVMSFRWKDQKNQFDVSGMIDADWQRAAGQGTHATLSPFDMHNTLIAAGPDLKRGEVDDLPSGNVDLAPTILQLLGIKTLQKIDGRILYEAMTGRVDAVRLHPKAPGTAQRRYETQTTEARKDFPSGTWKQSLRISRVGSTIYLDEGNGAFTPK
jgi:arylsulfatase A-like enzyme